MKHSSIRSVAKLAVVFLGVCVVFFVGTFFVLRSQAFLNFVIPKVQAELKQRAGVEASFDKMQLDWLRDILISNAKVRLKNPELGDVSVSIGTIHVQLSLWELLNHRLEVNSVALSDVNLVARIKQGPEAPRSPPSNPLALLADLLQNPPLTVSLPKVHVQNLSLDVQIMERNGAAVEMSSDHINTDVSLAFKKNFLGANFSLVLGNSSGPLSKIHVRASGLPGLQVATFDSEMFLNFDFNFSLSKEVSGWWLRFPRADVSVALSKMGAVLQQNSKEQQKIQVSFDHFEFLQKLADPVDVNIDGVMAFRSSLPTSWLQDLKKEIPNLLKKMTFEQRRQIELSLKNLRGEISGKQTHLLFGTSLDLKTLTSVVLQKGVLDVEIQKTALELREISFRSNKSQALGLGRFVAEPFAALRIPLQSIFSFVEKPDAAALVSGFEVFRAGSKLDIENPVGVPVHLSKPLSVDAKLDIEPHSRNFNIVTDMLLGNKSFLKSKIGIQDKEKNLELKTQIQVNILPEFRQVHPAAAVFDQFGYANVDASVGLSLLHDAKNIFSFSPKMIPGVKLKSQVQARVEQVLPVTSGKVIVRYNKLELNANSDVDISGHKYVLNGAVHMLGKPLAEFGFNGNDGPKFFKILGRVAAHIDPGLADVHAAAAAIRKFGNAELAADFDVGVSHPFSSVAAFDPKFFTSKASSVRKPLLGVNAKVNSKLALPGVHRTVSDFKTAQLFTYLRLAEPYIKTADVELAAETDLVSRARVRSLRVNAGDKKVLLSVTGETDLRGENVDMHGSVEVALPPEVALNKKTTIKTSGRARIPWQLQRSGGKDFHLSGKTELLDVGVELGDIAVRNMSGAVVFSQDLRLLNGKQIAWARLLEVSPFLRVDTDRIRPYLVETPLVRIPVISAMGRTIGPLRARVSFMQNQLALEDVDLSLFDGAYSGKIFVDVQPQAPRVAFLGRLAGLDTALLNPSKKQNVQSGESRYLAARLAFGLDVSKSLAEGRIDVTEIGSSQLKALIQVLDPDGKDSMLNAARMGVSAAYPTYVGMNMSQGYLDIGIQLAGLTPLRFDARQLPLTSIITPYTHNLMNTLREVPLQ